MSEDLRIDDLDYLDAKSSSDVELPVKISMNGLHRSENYESEEV